MSAGPRAHGNDGSDSAGLMIIRAWAEEDGTVRARLVLTTDVSRSVQIVRSLDSAEEVHVAVREWLADLALSAATAPP